MKKIIGVAKVIGAFTCLYITGHLAGIGIANIIQEMFFTQEED